MWSDQATAWRGHGGDRALRLLPAQRSASSQPARPSLGPASRPVPDIAGIILILRIRLASGTSARPADRVRLEPCVIFRTDRVMLRTYRARTVQSQNLA